MTGKRKRKSPIGTKKNARLEMSSGDGGGGGAPVKERLFRVAERDQQHCPSLARAVIKVQKRLRCGGSLGVRYGECRGEDLTHFTCIASGRAWDGVGGRRVGSVMATPAVAVKRPRGSLAPTRPALPGLSSSLGSGSSSSLGSSGGSPRATAGHDSLATTAVAPRSWRAPSATHQPGAARITEREATGSPGSPGASCHISCGRCARRARRAAVQSAQTAVSDEVHRGGEEPERARRGEESRPSSRRARGGAPFCGATDCEGRSVRSAASVETQRSPLGGAVALRSPLGGAVALRSPLGGAVALRSAHSAL
ncbi:unnamed protein product [Lampetra fluviatilis]